MTNALTIHKVTSSAITIDANPPLAGKRLVIDMELKGKKSHLTLLPATFACGCFWGLELAFQRVEGVYATAVGYTQGFKENPTYEEVCSEKTGHCEAVTVLYDRWLSYKPRIHPSLTHSLTYYLLTYSLTHSQ